MLDEDSKCFGVSSQVALVIVGGNVVDCVLRQVSLVFVLVIVDGNTMDCETRQVRHVVSPKVDGIVPQEVSFHECLLTTNYFGIYDSSFLVGRSSDDAS